MSHSAHNIASALLRFGEDELRLRDAFELNCPGWRWRLGMRTPSRGSKSTGYFCVIESPDCGMRSDGCGTVGLRYMAAGETPGHSFRRALGKMYREAM